MSKNKQVKVKEPKVKVYKKTAATKIVSHVWKMIIIAVLAFLALYVVLAAMIVRVVPAGSDIGPIVIKNTSYYGGFVPNGEIVLVNNAEEVDTGPLGNIKMAIPFMSEDVSLIEVKAGPFGKFKWVAPGVVTIDGEVVDGGFLPRRDENDKSMFERSFLKGEYIGLCIEGNCIPGDLVIFGENHIMGSPVSEVDIEEAINKDVTFFPNSTQSGATDSEVVIDENFNSEGGEG